MLKIHKCLIAVTVCSLLAAAGAQESLVNQAQQTGGSLVKQASDLLTQTGQQAIKQIQQSQLVDPQRLLEFGMSPIKYYLPGVSSDLGNGYMILSDGANKAYNSFSTMGDSLLGNFQSVQQSLLNRYAQMNQQQEDIVRRMREIVNNPEQFCRQIRQEGQSAYEKANGQASSILEQVTRRPSSSWFGK